MRGTHHIVYVTTPAAGATAAHVSSGSATTAAVATEEFLCLTGKLLPHVFDLCGHICTPVCRSNQHSSTHMCSGNVSTPQYHALTTVKLHECEHCSCTA
eukprot:6903-Heterococcus_DN1.PRE.1